MELLSVSLCLLEVCELECLPTSTQNWPVADKRCTLDTAVVTILKGVYTGADCAYDNQVGTWLVDEKLFSKDSIALLSPDEKGLEDKVFNAATSAGTNLKRGSWLD